MAHFQIIRPENMLLTHNTGVQITPEATCEHGHPAVYLVLLGAYRASPDQDARVHALVPRCVLAELVGSLQAQIRRDEGEDALQQFRDDIAAHTEESAAALEELHQQRRDCCEAGFRTNGTEHTCGRNTDQEGTTP